MTCMVEACPTEVPVGKVSCTMHWTLVPRDIKVKLYECYENKAVGSLIWSQTLAAAARAAKAGDLRGKSAA